jgi:predicted nucleotidyltransferase
MRRLDAKTEKTIEKFTHEIQRLYGDDLVSLVLYGSAAGTDFVPDRSDLNFLVVAQARHPGGPAQGHALGQIMAPPEDRHPDLC